MSQASADRPEPDRIDGAPHPRDTVRLIGQASAEAGFLDAFSSGRLHHGWLLTGPRGVGKATLAWSIARFLLATPDPEAGGLFGAPEPPGALAIDPEHPVARRIAAGSEPGIFALRRPVDEKSGRLKQQTTVDEVRRLKAFFSLSAADGGRRVVIVDAADDMNVNAANALLKLLEEPPDRTTLLLVAHQPDRLLPTIRSRCRTLRLHPLSAEDMAKALDQAGIGIADPVAMAELSGGAVGEAVRLQALDGLALYADLVALMATLPRLDRARALALAEACAARGAEAKLDVMIHLIDLFLARMARAGATGHAHVQQAAPGEATLFARLAPDARAARAWADLAQTAGARLRHGRAVNLDPAALILDTFLKCQTLFDA